MQQQSAVYWMHEDPVAKSKRVTDSAGNVVSTIELDPWGGETNRSSNEAFQPKKFTSYERDVNGSDEAMHRRYNRWWGRFEQPDPYDGSYDFTNPQSFNRYAYVLNDPVSFVDPSGLDGELGQGIGVARDALQYSSCRSVFGNQNALNLLNQMVARSTLQVATHYAQPRDRGRDFSFEQFAHNDIGAVTTYGTGAVIMLGGPNGWFLQSGNRITINPAGFYMTGRTTDGVNVLTARGRGFTCAWLTRRKRSTLLFLSFN